jgi:PAS domain S-box-containing protein
MDPNVCLKKIITKFSLENQLKLNFSDNMVHGAFFGDKNGKLININSKFEKITGYSLKDLKDEEILPKKIWFNENDRKEYIKDLDLKGNVSQKLAYLRHKKGHIIPVTISSTYSTNNFDNNKNIIGIQGFIQDYRNQIDTLFKSQLDSFIEKKLNILDYVTSTDVIEELIIKTIEYLPNLFHADKCSLFLYNYEDNQFELKGFSNNTINNNLKIIYDQTSRTPINYAVRMDRPLVVIDNKAIITKDSSIDEPTRNIIEDITPKSIFKCIENTLFKEEYEIIDCENLGIQLIKNNNYENDNFIIIPHSIHHPIKKLTGVICLSNLDINKLYDNINEISDNCLDGFGVAKKFISEVFDTPKIN